MSELPQEARDIYNRANEIAEAAQRKNKLDQAFWHDYAGLMSLAVKKSGNIPFSSAHAELGHALWMLGKNGEAEKELNIALHQDPNDWRAQLYKLGIYGEKIRNVPSSPKNYVHVETQNFGRDGVDQIFSTIFGSIVGTAFKATAGAISAGVAINSHSAFKAEVEKLATICRNVCETNTDVDEYLTMTEMLMGVGDEIKTMPLTGGRPNLYEAVAGLSIAKLDSKGREQEIKDVRNKAEGKSLLLKG